MKKMTRKGLIISLIIMASCLLIQMVDASGYFSYNLPTATSGFCIEDGHQGANDCNRAFFGIGGTQVLSPSNYWQQGTGTGHYIGFNFYKSEKISRYSIVNTDNDTGFYITAWHLTALTSTGEVTIDTQTGITRSLGVKIDIEIANPIYSNVYKLYIDTPGASGILITQIQMFEGGINNGDTITNLKTWVNSDDFIGTLELLELKIFTFAIHIIVIWLAIKAGLFITRPRKGLN